MSTLLSEDCDKKKSGKRSVSEYLSRYRNINNVISEYAVSFSCH